MFARLGLPDPQAQPYWVWPGVFGFQTSLNEGALFGMGQGMVALFGGLSVLAALGVLYWLFVAGAARDRLLTVALACVMAGVLGNLYDRFGLPGLEWNGLDGIHQAGQHVYAVRDWILMVPFGFHWPNYNIADSLLVCGAGLLDPARLAPRPAGAAVAGGPPGDRLTPLNPEAGLVNWTVCGTVADEHLLPTRPQRAPG